MCVCVRPRRPAHPVQKDDHAGTCPLSLAFLSLLPRPPPHTPQPPGPNRMLACPEYLSKIEAASNGNELLAVFESLNEAIKAKSITLVKSELVGIVKEKKVALKDEWTPAVALEFGGALRAFGGAAEVNPSTMTAELVRTTRPASPALHAPHRRGVCDGGLNRTFQLPTAAWRTAWLDPQQHSPSTANPHPPPRARPSPPPRARAPAHASAVVAF